MHFQYSDLLFFFFITIPYQSPDQFHYYIIEIMKYKSIQLFIHIRAFALSIIHQPPK